MADQGRFGAIAAPGSPGSHPARGLFGARPAHGAAASSAPEESAPRDLLPQASLPQASARPSRPDAPPDVSRAIESAARRTGVDFQYLLETARKESALDPQAKAATSSATGLYQFIDQTWLGVLKETGAAHGYAAAADAITGGPGRYRVGEGARDAVMALRRDPQASASMAAELTRRNADALRQALGRDPTRGELYIAHVMGASGGARLIALAEAQPQADASATFPRAAAANRAIFFRGGAPRGAAEVVAMLSRGLEGVPDDGSGEITLARARARTWWDTMGGMPPAPAPAHDPGFAQSGFAEMAGQTLPRPRLDVASAASVTQAAHAYGRIGALSR